MSDVEQDLEGIRAALSAKDATEGGLGDKAARYATACRDVNQRLRRCDDLLRKGLRGESLQQAQVAPPLLDEFALLDFPERDAWVSFAKEQGLTVPPPLQTMLAVELNHAFAEAD